MAFMVPVIEYGAWYVVECDDGASTVVPADLIGDPPATAEAIAGYVDGEPATWERVHRWGVRLSAPGYADCTDWTLHDSEAAARKDLRESYEVCPYTGDTLPDADGGCDCMHCGDADSADPDACRSPDHRICSHDGVDCTTHCACGDCFDDGEEASDPGQGSGYTPCACRDCMEIAVSGDTAKPDYCSACEGACGPEHTTSTECQAEGGDDDNA